MSELTKRVHGKPLLYNPGSGVLTWASDAHPRFVGRVAGSVDSNGYILIEHLGKKYKAHRLAWEAVNGPIAPGLEIDHINGITTDNRISNIRLATRAENCRNTKSASGSSSRFKGVGFHKATGKWAAFIRDGLQTKWLGLHRTEEGAAEAYDAAASVMFGEFARLNKARALLEEK